MKYENFPVKYLSKMVYYTQKDVIRVVKQINHAISDATHLKISQYSYCIKHQ